MMATGTSSPIRKPRSAGELAREIACELRGGPGGKRWEDVIEAMILKALRDGGIKSHD